jgi:hypothetical protein|tara:strand:+ start:62 stop:376 length:315 start_codon:yes stop_codon:yes gene_type:complete
MISLLTNIVLDATFGVAWWVTKTSYYGIKNSVNYLFFYTEEESSYQELKILKDSLTLDYSITNKTDGTLESTIFFISDFNKLINEKNIKIATLEEKVKLLENLH